MNWPNYDLLVEHVRTIDPRLFDYEMNPVSPLPDSAGCLGYHCRVVSQAQRPVSIAAFLDITAQEERYLLGARSTVEPDAMGFHDMVRLGIARGAMGVDEVLRRLAVVAARYERPGGEVRFLSSVRAVAGTVAKVCLVVAAVAAISSCDREASHRVPKPEVGSSLSDVFFRDLNTGRCVHLREIGRHGYLDVVDARWCEGRNIK